MDTINNNMPKTQSSGIIKKLKRNICQKEVEVNDEEDAALLFHVDKLTPRMQNELKYILNETEESREKGLKELRELIDKEKNLVSRTDDNFLLQFLRARKYDVKRAFKLLQNYYGLRKELDNIYVATDETKKKIRETIMRAFAGFLTHRDRNGCVVFIVKVGMWNPEVDTFEDVVRMATGSLTYAIELPATQICGFSAIFDLRNITWKQVKLCTPKNIFLLIRSTQFCFPGRYKDIHVLTENKLFNLVWTIVYPFLTKKLKTRIHFHGKDLSGLQKFIHPSVLPEEFGGQSATYENSSWIDIVYDEKNELKFVNWLKYGYK